MKMQITEAPGSDVARGDTRISPENLFASLKIIYQ